MNVLTVRVETENEAMRTPMDLCNAMHRVAYMLGCGKTGGPVMDVNGNTVGRWEWKKDEVETEPAGK